MFIQNKYTTWYYNIINKAKSENRVKSKNQYFEKHHIVPKSLGGNNSKENLVLLTAREHFIIHWLLVNMTEDLNKCKMWYALANMRRKSKYNNQRTLTSAQFNICKKANSKNKIILTIEQEQKRRESIKNSWKFAYERKLKTKERFRKYSEGPKSDEIKSKISKTLTGQKHPEWRNRQKSIQQTKTWRIFKETGLMLEICNRKLWCKENNYNDSKLSLLHKNKIKKHLDIIKIEIVNI